MVGNEGGSRPRYRVNGLMRVILYWNLKGVFNITGSIAREYCSNILLNIFVILHLFTLAYCKLCMSLLFPDAVQKNCLIACDACRLRLGGRGVDVKNNTPEMRERRTPFGGFQQSF